MHSLSKMGFGKLPNHIGYSYLLFSYTTIMHFKNKMHFTSQTQKFSSGIGGFPSWFRILFFFLFHIISCTNKIEKLPDNVFYTCSMDPQVMEKKPGKCPICKMDLTKIIVDPHQEGIKLSDDQVALAHILTDKVTLQMQGVAKVLEATIVENKNNKSSISARVEGRIEKLYFKNTGETIRKGQIIYELYSEALLAGELDYLAAIAQETQAGIDVINSSPFVAAAKNKLLLWGLTAEQIAQLEKNKIANAIMPIKSPAQGVVTSVSVGEGDYISDGSALFELANYATVWVEAQVYASEVANIQPHQGVNVRVAAFPNSIIKANISFINPQLQSESKVGLIRIEISNTQGLYKPGMQAHVDLIEDKHQALFINANAVLQDSKGATVWVKMPDNTYQIKMVTAGIRTENAVEITEGLQEGDEVVVSGSYLLNSEYIFRKGSNPTAEMKH